VAVDSIIRVSFQSSVPALQAANNALVGHQSAPTGNGPFIRVGTAAFSAQGQPEQEVANALAGLGAVLAHYAEVLDFVAISLVRRHDGPPAVDAEEDEFDLDEKK
jgi:hypothetical protein